jgi:hypothetical protein
MTVHRSVTTMEWALISGAVMDHPDRAPARVPSGLACPWHLSDEMAELIHRADLALADA